MIEGLLFDKDGTLFDFQKAWGPWIAGAIESLAPSPAARAEMAVAIGYDSAARRISPHSPIVAATVRDAAAVLSPFLPHWALEDLVGELDRRSAEVSLVEVTPLVPFFEELKARGFKVGLATNDTEVPARAHLAACGITRYFDFVAGYDSGFGGKPGPGMAEAFLRQMNLAPQAAVMVGDSLHDLHAGRAAGLRCVAVLTGVAGADELAPHADVVLPDISHLPAWLDSQNAALSGASAP